METYCTTPRSERWMSPPPRTGRSSAVSPAKAAYVDLDEERRRISDCLIDSATLRAMHIPPHHHRITGIVRIEQLPTASRAGVSLERLERSVREITIRSLPASTDFCQILRSPAAHSRNLVGGRGSVLIGRRPDDHVHKGRCEIYALPREPVRPPPLVFDVRAALDDAVPLKPGKTIREDVGSHTLATFQEFAKRGPAFQHKIADDEERPTVPHHLQRDAKRTI